MGNSKEDDRDTRWYRLLKPLFMGTVQKFLSTSEQQFTHIQTSLAC